MFGITEPTPNSSCLKISYGSGSCFLQKWSILGRVSSKNQLHLPGWTYRSRLVAVFAFITGGDGLRVLEQQSRSMLHISCSSLIFRVVPHIFEWPTTTHHIADQLFQSFFTHFPYSNFLRMSMMAVQFFFCPVRLLIIPLSPAWVFTTDWFSKTYISMKQLRGCILIEHIWYIWKEFLKNPRLFSSSWQYNYWFTSFFVEEILSCQDFFQNPIKNGGLWLTLRSLCFLAWIMRCVCVCSSGGSG